MLLFRLKIVIMKIDSVELAFGLSNQAHKMTYERTCVVMGYCFVATDNKNIIIMK